MKFLVFGAGVATGYVLGARAGRERYEQIVSMARGIAGNPKVQHGAKVAGTQAASLAGSAGSAAAHAAADVGGKVVDKAKDVVSRDDHDDNTELGPITAANSTGTTNISQARRTGTS